MTKLGFISFVFVVILATLGCGSKKASLGSGLSYEKRKVFDQQFFEATKQKALNNKDKALTIYQQALETDPTSSAVMYEVAKLFYLKESYNEALYWSKKAVENSKEYNHWYYGQLAQFYNKFGKYPESAEVFAKMISNEPDVKENYTEAANQYYNARDFQNAIDVVLKMQKKFGVDLESAHRLEFIYRNSGQPQKGIDALKQLCKLYPENIEYKGYLAESYVKSDQLTEAIEIFNEMISLDSNNGVAYFMLYNIYSKQAEDDLAYKNLRKAFFSDEVNLVEKLQAAGSYFLKINKDEKTKNEILELSDILLDLYPNSPEPFVLKSDIYNSLGDYVKARSYIEQGISISSNEFRLWIKLLKLDEKLKKPQLVLDDASKALELYPNVAELYKTKAFALYHLSNYNEAIEVAEEGLEVAIEKQDKIKLIMCKALAYNKLNNNVKSDNLYLDILKLDPNNAAALNNYAYNLASRGEQLAVADSLIDLALKIEGSNPMLLDTKAWVLFHMQKYTEALDWLNKAVALDPKNIDYYVHSKEVYQKLGNQTLANEMQKIIDRLTSENVN